MKHKNLLTAVCALLASVGAVGASIGIAVTAQAGPPMATGVAGLSFVVEVKELGVGGQPGPNCYTFLDDESQTWLDPLFLPPEFGGLFPGTWEADQIGPVTHYTATASTPDGFVVLVQTGQVTPSFAKGQRQLRASSTAYVGGEVVAEFISTGYEGFDEELCLSDVPSI